MAARGAKLLIDCEDSASKKIIAYDFDLGQWIDIVATDTDVTSNTLMIWDGAYHAWIQHNGTWWKRLNLIDYSLEDWIQDHPYPDINYQWGCHDYNGGIETFRSAVPRCMRFHHGIGSWGAMPDPGFAATPTSVPLTATYKPGQLFAVDSTGVAISSYDFTTGVWTSLTPMASGSFCRGDLCWANEFVYSGLQSPAGQFWQYDVNGDSWLRMADRPGLSGVYGRNLTWDYNDAGYLYSWVYNTKSIYQYDIAGDSWGSFATYTGTVENNSSIEYVPRIRFVYLNSGGTLVTDPLNLACQYLGEAGAGILYYLKALEPITGVTLEIEADPRTDADDLLDVAPDNNGVPGAWGSSVNMGNFAENEAKPFWIRIDASGNPATSPRCARLHAHT